MDSDGHLLWNTFLGGNGDDSSNRVVIAPSGELYVSGRSNSAWGCSSTNCTHRAFSNDYDGYLAALDTDGNLVWNTFLGSADRDGTSGFVALPEGKLAVVGSSKDTWSCSDLPCTVRPYSANSDAFVAVLDSNGKLRWNSFLGGNDADTGEGVGVDAVGNLYFAGTSDGTWGEPDRVFAAGKDASVAVVDPDGHLLWNSFIGAWDYEDSSWIALQQDGQVVIAGVGDSSWGSPIRPYTKDKDVFVAALRPEFATKDLGSWLPLVFAR